MAHGQAHAVPQADPASVQADAIEVIVHRLRRKIAGSGAEIMTLRGEGYLLCKSAEPAHGDTTGAASA